MTIKSFSNLLSGVDFKLQVPSPMYKSNTVNVGGVRKLGLTIVVILRILFATLSVALKCPKK